MKTLKTFITLLLLMICTAVEAQSIIVIEKTDGTKDEYNIAEVDSVAYEPKEEVKYYYYAGWNCPTDLTTLAQLAVAPNGGFIGNTLGAYSANNMLHDFIENPIGPHTSKAQFYVIIPKGIKIYDADKLDTTDAFTLEGTIGEHNVYKSVVSTRNIDYIYIF